jgi:hypothetical protein
VWAAWAREPARRPGRAISPRSFPSRVVAVEGIPVFRKAALFAGRCRNEGLGRLVIGYSGFLRGIERAGDSGCPKVAQEGNAVGLRHFKRRHRTQATGHRRMHHGTRPSLGPSTRARQSSLCTVRATGGGGALTEASRLGKPAQAGGTSTGVIEADVARLAAYHRSRKGEAWCEKKRKAVEAVVPART